MKKILAFIIVFGYFTIPSFAQIGHFGINVDGSFRIINRKYGDNKLSLNALYLFNVGPVFKIGLGSGLSYNDVRVNEMVKYPYKYQERKKLLAVPLFLRGQINLLPKANFAPYLGFKLGTRFASTEGVSENTIYPFLFEHTLFVGYRMNLNGYNLGLELGLDYNLGFVDTQTWRENKRTDELQPKFLVFSKNELSVHNSLGLYFGLIFLL